jgi:hypothetical protein
LDVTERLTIAYTLHAEKYIAVELLQQGYHQEMATAASYNRELEVLLAASTSRCNTLEVAEISARKDAANRPDAVKMVGAAKQVEKVDAAAITETGKTSEDRKAYAEASQENLAAVP